MGSFAVSFVWIQQLGRELALLLARLIYISVVFAVMRDVAVFKISKSAVNSSCVIIPHFLYLSFLDFKSKFELERKDTDSYNSSTTSISQQQHSSPLLPLPLPAPPHPFSSSSSSAGVSGAGGVPIATPAHLPDSTTDSWSGYYGTQRQDGVGKPFSNKGALLKQRCRDYDGRNKVMFSSFFFS